MLLSRAFLRESCRMLVQPCDVWRGMGEDSRESYACRAASSHLAARELAESAEPAAPPLQAGRMVVRDDGWLEGKGPPQSRVKGMLTETWRGGTLRRGLSPRALNRFVRPPKSSSVRRDSSARFRMLCRGPLGFDG